MRNKIIRPIGGGAARTFHFDQHANVDKIVKIDSDRSVTPGVFLCVYTDHPQIREDLNYLDVTGSDGYNMYTPYHLVTNEIPLSVVNAVEFGHLTIVPKLGLVTEVFGAANRPLKAGETIDGTGGASVYALNDLYETAKAEKVVRLGLLTGAKLRCNVPRLTSQLPTIWSISSITRPSIIYAPCRTPAEQANLRSRSGTWMGGRKSRGR